MILEKVTANKAQIAEILVLIWECSIKKTQSFLTEQDIAKQRPLVKLAIKNMQILIVAKKQCGDVIGFIAIENKKVEMLFVKPNYFNKGVGKALLFFAIENYDVMLVDVNEQNKKALTFYEYMGFTVFGCSRTDDSPFPILHMKWKGK